MTTDIGYIYKVTSPSGKVYIGQTSNLYYRKYKYKTLRCKAQPRIYNSIKKYGWDSHVFEVIDQCSIIENRDVLNEKETYWISFYNSIGDNGLNCSTGGLTRKMSDETKEKIRQIQLKQYADGKVTWNKGIPCSNEQKEKIRLSSIGKHDGERNQFFGKKHTDEFKEWQRQRNIGKKQSAETIEKRIRTMTENRKLKGKLPYDRKTYMKSYNENRKNHK